MPQVFAEAVQAAGQDLIVDVGANTGFYSLLAVAVSGSVKVVAYEPMEQVRRILMDNVALNRAGDRISVLDYAASDSNGNSTLFVPHDTHGLVETSASLSADFKDTIGSTQPVVTRTLDSVHSSRSRVAIVKVDAEGHDLSVLRGAEKLMLRDRPIVFVEVLLGADEQGLTDLMSRCLYQDIVLFPEGASAPGDRVIHQTRAWNHMWIPRPAL